MSERNGNVSAACAEFQAQLPELLADGNDLSGNPHVEGCPNCSALVRDLFLIAQQAKLLLPLHDPSPVVWERIESSLQQGKNQHG